jgi:hypothetical protein
MDHKNQVLSYYGAKLEEFNPHYYNVCEDTTEDGYGIYTVSDNHQYVKVFMNEASARDEVIDLIENGHTFSCDEHLEPEWQEMWYGISTEKIDEMFLEFTTQTVEKDVFPLMHSLATEFLTDNEEFKSLMAADEDIDDFRPKLLNKLADAIKELAADSSIILTTCLL